jgi:SAM-dependent methyltransferase
MGSSGFKTINFQIMTNDIKMQKLSITDEPAIAYSTCYMPLILDACCGGRQFWFDKENPNVLFADQRVMEPKVVGSGKDARIRKCLPDKVMDFRNMDIADQTFKLVVFDPPHLFLGENSYMAQSYGRLDKQTWKEDISRGFSECFRVLKDEGILIFKWNECDVPLKEVLKLTTYKPLFGHPSGKAQKTHWVCFMKLPFNGI